MGCDVDSLPLPEDQQLEYEAHQALIKAYIETVPPRTEGPAVFVPLSLLFDIHMAIQGSNIQGNDIATCQLAHELRATFGFKEANSHKDCVRPVVTHWHPKLYHP